MLVVHVWLSKDSKSKDQIKRFQSKDLTKRTESDKVLRDNAFKIASDPKYDGYQRGLGSMVYNFFDKKISGGAIKAKANYQLADKLQKQIIRKFKKRSLFIF